MQCSFIDEDNNLTAYLCKRSFILIVQNGTLMACHRVTKTFKNFSLLCLGGIKLLKYLTRGVNKNSV